MRADTVRAYVESLLEKLIGVQQVTPDDDGDYPVRYRGALYYVRVVGSEDPVVQVFSVAVADVAASPAQFKELNTINSNIKLARTFWVRDQVLVESEMLSLGVEPADFDNACRAVATITGRYGPQLALRFGGADGVRGREGRDACTVGGGGGIENRAVPGRAPAHDLDLACEKSGLFEARPMCLVPSQERREFCSTDNLVQVSAAPSVRASERYATHREAHGVNSPSGAPPCLRLRTGLAKPPGLLVRSTCGKRPDDGCDVIEAQHAHIVAGSCALGEEILQRSVRVVTRHHASARSIRHQASQYAYVRTPPTEA